MIANMTVTTFGMATISQISAASSAAQDRCTASANPPVHQRPRGPLLLFGGLGYALTCQPPQCGTPKVTETDAFRGTGPR